MRALVVAPHPFFTPRGTPFSVYYRTLITTELGVDVDLLTYWEGEGVAIPGVRVIRIPWVPFTSHVRVGPSLNKLVYDMHSSLPQQLSNFEFTKSHLLIQAFERLEKAALRAASAIITICPDL